MSKPTSPAITVLLFLMTILLAGCAVPDPDVRSSAGAVGPPAVTEARPETVLPPIAAPGQAPSSAPAASSASIGAATPPAWDEHAEMTCAMHQKLQIAMTPKERQAVIAAHMKDMPPEMRKRYLDRLQNCTGR